MEKANTGNITVVDDFMGKGKTTYAIQFINEHPEYSYVYCTPFLDEVDRIRESCPAARFVAPTYRSGRKIDDFNMLLMNGENIVVTHSTFANANEETVEYIRNAGYILIMDETLSTLEEFNNVCSDAAQKVYSQDIKMLTDNKNITVDDYGYCKWNGESYLGGKYSDVERLAKNNTLILINGTFLAWQFPAYIFALFKEVIVLTYCFDGSILKPYFEYHDLSWEKKSVECIAGKYQLIPYREDVEYISVYQKLITIYDNNKSNNYKNYALSKNWFKKQKNEVLKTIRNNLANFFINRMKAKSKDILWTCPKNFYDKLKSKGYISVRRLTPEEKALPKQEQEKLQRKLSCFLPCNSRATNDYKDRSVLAYCMNMYINPYVKEYFKKKSIKDGIEIKVDENLFSLQMMLQWIFRSRIREFEPITIYVPSTRMRELLVKWLSQGDNSTVTGD